MKSTRIELTPDDPIFHGDVQLFKPISKPSTKDDKPIPQPSMYPWVETEGFELSPDLIPEDVEEE